MGKALGFFGPVNGVASDDGDTEDSNVVYLMVWGLELTRRILSSISLTFWYWRGHNLVMDFSYDKSVAMYLNNQEADKSFWEKIHSVFFQHYCQNMLPKRRVPFVIKRFKKSEIRDGNVVRVYFEVESWAGKCIDGKPVEDDFYGNLTDENASMFECRFILKTEERR